MPPPVAFLNYKSLRDAVRTVYMQELERMQDELERIYDELERMWDELERM